MNLKYLLLATATSLLLPVAASALERTVRYDVNAKELKSCPAGTPITYHLYSDAACTLEVDTQVFNVEDLDTIEVLKTFTPKGGTKPPKTARVWHAYSISPGRWFTHAKLTGTGITPVGSDCQAQFNYPATAMSSSVPGMVANIAGGYTSLATLSIDAPAAGKVSLLFETMMNANDTSQYVVCTVSDNAAPVAGFEIDPGDQDSPIPWYDLSQSHTEVITVAQGNHVFDVSCNLSGGADANAFGSKLVATFFGAGL